MFENIYCVFRLSKKYLASEGITSEITSERDELYLIAGALST